MMLTETSAIGSDSVTVEALTNNKDFIDTEETPADDRGSVAKRNTYILLTI
jgi:hypothetical protein